MVLDPFIFSKPLLRITNSMESVGLVEGGHR